MRTHVIVEGPAEPDGVPGEGDVRIHANSDWSGEARLQWVDDKGEHWKAIPGHVAQALVEPRDQLLAMLRDLVLTDDADSGPSFPGMQNARDLLEWIDRKIGRRR